ncbi:serine protease inhibitor 42Dd-like [Cochliomyia hominivorax]
MMTSLKSAILILALIACQQCNAGNYNNIISQSTFELSNSSIVLPIEDPGEDVINILFPNENDMSEEDTNILISKEKDSENGTEILLLIENSTDRTITTSEAPHETLNVLFPHKHSEENTTKRVNSSMESTSETLTEGPKKTPFEILYILFPHKYSEENTTKRVNSSMETTSEAPTEGPKETPLFLHKHSEERLNSSMESTSETSTEGPKETPLEILDILFPHKHSEENTTKRLNSSIESTSEAPTEGPKETPLEILDILFPHKHSEENSYNFLNPTIETTTETTTKTPKENLFVDDFIYMLFEEKNSEKVISSTTLAPEAANETSDHNLFAADLFSVIAETELTENVVYSPASIQICLALAYMGAEGETAENMRKILRLGKGDRLDVAISYNEFLKNEPNSENIAEEMPILKIANRLYVNEIVKISQNFNEIAKHYFNAETEKVNFNDAENSIEKINKWVEEQTENKIKNLLTTKDVSVDTNAILVNAIYFKAKWLNPFSLSSSYNSKFYINENKTQDVDFMYNEEYFSYADLPDLKASALEMPYENSDLSMLFLLPYDIEGLEKLQVKLRGLDLNDITSQMKQREVEVHLPRFKIEFDIDLKEPLKKLGLTNIFDKNANFKGIFYDPEFQSISEVKHKAYLDVNEAGSEAAAATFSTLVTLSAPFDVPTFRANHPFVFAIRSKSAVYFAGHVASI